MARGVPLGPRALSRAGPRGGGCVDHAGGDRHRHAGDPAGPMVTPLARRRPVKVARETASLDRLSGGRLTLGVGLGDEQAGNEYSITGEELDERRRARMLDESLEILTAAWTGEPVHHRGEHYVVDGMRFLPRPVQGPGVGSLLPPVRGGDTRRSCTRRIEELSAELTSLEVRRSELAQRCADLRKRWSQRSIRRVVTWSVRDLAQRALSDPRPQRFRRLRRIPLQRATGAAARGAKRRACGTRNILSPRGSMDC